jgi:hypothetical protein
MVSSEVGNHRDICGTFGEWQQVVVMVDLSIRTALWGDVHRLASRVQGQRPLEGNGIELIKYQT